MGVNVRLLTAVGVNLEQTGVIGAALLSLPGRDAGAVKFVQHFDLFQVIEGLRGAARERRTAK